MSKVLVHNTRRTVHELHAGIKTRSRCGKGLNRPRDYSTMTVAKAWADPKARACERCARITKEEA